MSLGDCLLHRTHHEMTGQCWNTVIDRYFHLTQPAPHGSGLTDEQARERYKAEYERACLDQLRKPFRCADCRCDPEQCADEEGEHCHDRRCTWCIHGCPSVDEAKCCQVVAADA
ncbi:hypothetical protein GCM10009555_017990 [Acrocarpospora macrocephala]|uniref:Uncharacterized protein n=1 Tax=Acrocarpospora macrocephala TaxID=150177 RepID=A0A5M3WGU2_9ACTN|nr:hypothetical protein [Acrocarpospora macrocephala]GES07459.1 hypothetical protein Amac_010540 [Acrocarpospora macrocephala]